MATQPLLQVEYQATSAANALQKPNVLAVFEFGVSPLKADAPGHVPVALQQLDARPAVEVWTAEGPFESGRLGEVRFVRGMQLTMGHIALDLKRYAGMREASRVAYQELQQFLGRSPHHWPLKIWNYIPGINQAPENSDPDSENYRQFCVGRAEALAEGYGDQPPMPAATGIGTDASEPALQIYFLAGALPGLNVENPRQVNAWQYPRQYGPRSPLFSRGTILKTNGERQFLISGTASVIGHESQHGTAAAQATESLRNVESLLQEGGRLTGTRFCNAHGEGALKIYVRNPDDLTSIESQISRSWAGNLPRIALQGDICRHDLLTEIDGIVSCVHHKAAR